MCVSQAFWGESEHQAAYLALLYLDGGVLPVVECQDDQVHGDTRPRPTSTLVVEHGGLASSI